MEKRRPRVDEYDHHYEAYVGLVPEKDVTGALREQLAETMSLLGEVAPGRIDYRYAPDKWTLREVVGHVLDTERVFSHRAFCFARGEAQPLPGMDENEYARQASVHLYGLADLARELGLVRRANISMFEHLAPEAWDRTGLANGLPVSVRALAYVLVGHARHHVRLLKEKYLAAA